MDKHTRDEIESIREVYTRWGKPWIRIVVWASDGAVTGWDFDTREEARTNARELRGMGGVAATYVVRT